MADGETGTPLMTLLAHLRMCAEFGQQAAPASSVGWRFRSWASLLLEYGRVFEPVPADRDVVPAVWRQEPGRCYIAAATWAIVAELPYVEGWACTDGVGLLGTEHAWVAGPDGTALDPTWRPGQGTVYIGVPFAPAYRQTHLRAALLHPGGDGAGLDLLRDGIPPGALAEAGQPISPLPDRVLGSYMASWLPGEAS